MLAFAHRVIYPEANFADDELFWTGTLEVAFRRLCPSRAGISSSQKGSTVARCSRGQAPRSCWPITSNSPRTPRRSGRTDSFSTLYGQWAIFAVSEGVRPFIPILGPVFISFFVIVAQRSARKRPPGASG